MKYLIPCSLALIAVAEAVFPAADMAGLYLVPLLFLAGAGESARALFLWSLAASAAHAGAGLAGGDAPSRALPGFSLHFGVCLTAVLAAARLFRRQALRLAASSDRLVDRAPDPMFVYGLNGKILDVNRAASRYLQYSRQELLEMKVGDFARLEDPEAARPAAGGDAAPAGAAAARSGESGLRELWDRLEAGGSRMVRATHRRKDGTRIPVEVHLACEWNGKERIFIAVVRDATAQQDRISGMMTRHEEQLRELQHSPRLLQRIMDSSDNLTYAKDLNGRYILCSLPTARFFGFDSADGVMGKRDADLLPAAQAEVFENTDRKVLADPDTVLSMEETIQKEDGGFQCFLTTIGAFRDEHGAVAGTFGISRDITGLRKAEMELRQSEERHHFAMEASNTGVWEWDLKTDRNFYSPVWKSMLGYEGGQPGSTQADFLKLVHPEDLEPLRKSIDGHLRGETPLHAVEIRLRARDGGWRWILTRGKVLQRDAGGQPLRMFGTHEDVTRSKKLTADLFSKNNRLELAADAGRFGIWEFNFLTGHLAWDERMFGLYGVREEDFRHHYQDWLDCLHPDDRQETERKWADHVAGRNGFEVEFLIIHKVSKEVRSIRARTVMVRDPDGSPVQAIGLNWDVTEDRRASDVLRKAKEAAEAGEKARSNFMATISHELRTPMNGVLGMADILLNTALTPAQREMVEVMRRSGRILLHLINDILDFSSIEAGKMRMVRAPFHLAEIHRDISDLMEALASRRRLKLVRHLDPGLEPALIGDAGRLRQVITNLVSNAIKFTERGQVTLALRHLETAGGGIRFRIEVTDTGVGIPAAHRGALFRPFKQVDQTSHRRFGGTGLGLAISNQIAEAMGGRIRLESGEGEGSRFWLDLTLPLAEGISVPGPAGEPPDEDSAPPIPWRPLRVLLVEDNEANQMVATLTLQEFGHAVTVAGNGVEALSVIGESGFDVILMDCRMPVLDGFETTWRIREGETLAGRAAVPIIALTASGMAGDRERCLEIGMNAYALKPITRRELARAFRACGLRLIPPGTDPENVSPAEAREVPEAGGPGPAEMTGPGEGAEPAEMTGSPEAGPEVVRPEPAETAGPARPLIPESGGGNPPPPAVLEPLRAAALRQLRASDGRDVLSVCIALLLEETPARLGRLADFVRDGDRSGIADTAHDLAGNCANIGAAAIHRALLTVEEHSRLGSMEDLASGLARVEAEWKILSAALAAFEPERMMPVSGRLSEKSG